MPLVSVNGTELHVEEAGAGPETIVFSHGLLWSGAMFEAQIAHFAARYRCVAYDHRGQGGSPPSRGPYDMETLAEDAAALIVARDAAPCHFVGLSMGGFVGQRLALRRRELLRSLVLVDTAADAEPRANVPKYRAMNLAARLLGYRALVGAIMKIMFAPPFLRDPARAAERARWRGHLLGLTRAPTQAALESVIRRRPIADQIARIATPTLVVHGAEDRAIVPPRARAMAEAIPGARWVAIPRAGHSSTIEEPAAVTAAIEDFLASLPRTELRPPSS
jgi:pimeloyl-ACP methyl ester carboxylesterase